MMFFKAIGIILFVLFCLSLALINLLFLVTSWYRDSKYYTGWEGKDDGNNR